MLSAHAADARAVACTVPTLITESTLRPIFVSYLLWACSLGVGSMAAQDVPVPDAEVPQRRELLRTDRFTVYLLDLPAGQATPMHRHDRDIASVFLTSTRTVSTFWKEPRGGALPIRRLHSRHGQRGHQPLSECHCRICPVPRSPGLYPECTAEWLLPASAFGLCAKHDAFLSQGCVRARRNGSAGRSVGRPGNGTGDPGHGLSMEYPRFSGRHAIRDPRRRDGGV